MKFAAVLRPHTVHAGLIARLSPLSGASDARARWRIVEAADELFLTRGFDNVTVGDIAEVGRTAFFRYFGDKQEVVFARKQELLEMIAAAAQDATIAAAYTATEAVEHGHAADTLPVTASAISPTRPVPGATPGPRPPVARSPRS